jgi:phosphoglycolate phosphatase-like HAD superfamily hydrolase
MRADYLASSPTRSSKRRRNGGDSLFALDSDGTVFDSMRPKHLEAFIPAFVGHFAPRHPEAAGEVWRFVNLESRSRGTNRYKALSQSLRLLKGHPAAGKGDVAWTRTASAIEAWLAREPSPSLGTLKRAAFEDSVLGSVLDWTLAVDAAIAGLPLPKAFPAAVAALPRIALAGEILVLTAAPEAAVAREWKEAGILGWTGGIAGQERGPKAACLAAAQAGRSPAAGGGCRVLVVGDAMGDLEAARCNGAAFFPVIPGREDECWTELASSGLERFAAGERSPSSGLLADFMAALPATPPWRNA